MKFEEALPLVRNLSATDKLRLIDELARELLAERAAVEPTASPEAPAGPARTVPEPTDEARWGAWLDTLLDAASERIAAKQGQMRVRGILDDAGGLATDALPADMRPGSKTSVASG